MARRGRILLLKDRAGLVARAEPLLVGSGFDVQTTQRVTEAFTRLRRQDCDALVTGLDLGGMTGLEVVERVFQDHGGLPVVVLLPENRAPQLLDEATRAGAHGVLEAPLDAGALHLLLDRAVEHVALRREVERLELAVAESRTYEDLLGGSPIMQELFDLVDRAARSKASVLITGESGTGKEVVARALHQRSGRNGSFVPINLAAVPDALLESELFGHAKGAFTDARAARRGLVLEADGGTLFLDEIGELSLTMQPKLLRALQEKKVRPVGSDRERSFDARIVAATNRDLEGMVADGTFREDLFYRLHVIHIALPPLRSRGSDILLLAHHFLERIAARNGKRVLGLSNAAARRLLAYRWPGNVRELENCLERAVALTRNEELQVEDLPQRVRGFKPEHVVVASSDPEELVPMHVVEARYIRRVMEAVQGNKSEAARILGFDRKTLRRKLARLDSEGP